jgi:hypothetical protein
MPSSSSRRSVVELAHGSTGYAAALTSCVSNCPPRQRRRVVVAVVLVASPAPSGVSPPWARVESSSRGSAPGTRLPPPSPPVATALNARPPPSVATTPNARDRCRRRPWRLRWNARPRPPPGPAPPRYAVFVYIPLNVVCAPMLASISDLLGRKWVLTLQNVSRGLFVIGVSVFPNIVRLSFVRFKSCRSTQRAVASSVRVQETVHGVR